MAQKVAYTVHFWAPDIRARCSTNRRYQSLGEDRRYSATICSFHINRAHQVDNLTSEGLVMRRLAALSAL